MKAGPRGSILALGAVVGLSVLVCAPSAAAAVTLGSDLQTAPVGTTSCSRHMEPRGCLGVDDVLPGGQLVAPFDGVIVGWRARLGNDTEAQTVRIRVVRRTSPNTFTGITSGALENVADGASLYSFSARLPIAAGDQVGIEAEGNQEIEWRAPLQGARSFEYNSRPADGATTGAPVFTNQDQEHTFNVDVEPDADGDGFGDETQDQCPGQAGPVNGCPQPEAGDSSPPLTTITDGPGDKTKKKAATFGFIGTDARAIAGFECSVDGALFAPCVSPYTVNVKTGKHTFQVRAVDQAGNVGTPASDSWKRKAKRRK